MNKASKDLGISFLKVRSSLARIYYTIKDLSLYNFIKDKAYKAYKTEYNKEVEGKKKGTRERAVWNDILSRIQEEAYPHERVPSGFYWKTEMWVKNLLKKVGEENISKYTTWWIKNKTEYVDNFNAGIFCCDKMIDEYKKIKHTGVSRKRIKDKKKTFENQSDEEIKKTLSNILKKKKSGKKLDSYDIEILKDLKEKGYYNG